MDFGRPSLAMAAVPECRRGI